jgi:hypothetical protein
VELNIGMDSIYNVLMKVGCKVCSSESMGFYRTRISITRGECPFLSSGYIDIVNKGNGIISQVDIHFDSFDTYDADKLKAFVGRRKDIALGLERSSINAPLIDVKETQQSVVDRIRNGIEGSDMQLVSATAITDHQVRLSFDSAIGGGELDLYFNKKGVLTSLGRNTLQKSDFEVLRESI